MSNQFKRMADKWAADKARLMADHKRDPEGSRRRWHALVDDNRRRERELRAKGDLR